MEGFWTIAFFFVLTMGMVSLILYCLAHGFYKMCADNDVLAYLPSRPVIPREDTAIELLQAPAVSAPAHPATPPLSAAPPHSAAPLQYAIPPQPAAPAPPPYSMEDTSCAVAMFPPSCPPAEPYAPCYFAPPPSYAEAVRLRGSERNPPAPQPPYNPHFTSPV